MDLLVQTYAPQPNFLHRPVYPEELLAPISSSYIGDLAAKVNDWDFHAGQLSMEDLIWSSVLILEHVVSTGGAQLAKYKLSRGRHLQNHANHRRACNVHADSPFMLSTDESLS